MRMIDKLECPVELGSPYTPFAQEVREEVRRGGNAIPWNKNKYFCGIVDCREVFPPIAPNKPVDALLHIQSRFGKHNDKIELLNTGEKSKSEMLEIVSHIYAGDPAKLETRRVDLCTDIEVSMDQMARSTRVAYKRQQRMYGEVTITDREGRTMDFMEIGKRDIQTLQYGIEPNPLRIYNKVEETRERYQSAKRRHENNMAWAFAQTAIENAHLLGIDKDAKRGLIKRFKAPASRTYPMPSFEAWSGYMEWQTVTRVERQIQGKMPLLISNVGVLWENVANFNPFERLHFPSPDTDLQVAKTDYSAIEWRAGLQMWESLQTGFETYQELYKSLGSNRKAIAKKYAPFLRAGTMARDGAKEITEGELFERYRESVQRQLAA